MFTLSRKTKLQNGCLKVVRIDIASSTRKFDQLGCMTIGCIARIEIPLF